MKAILGFAALVAVMGGVASAQVTEAPVAAVATIKIGTVLTSAEGRRIGRVDRIISARDGTPVAASLIFDGKIANIPLSTITIDDKNVAKTSLKVAEIRRL